MKLSLKEYDAMQSGWRKWINEHMEISGFKTWGMDFAGKDILEVGCGSGYSASLIVKDHPKSYTGMDIMPEQLEKAEALGLSGARFVQGDAADLSRFEDGSFDMIVDFMILHHVEGWRRFLDEAFRVLRPGGEMYINDLTRKGVHLTDFFFRWDHAEEPLFALAAVCLLSLAFILIIPHFAATKVLMSFLPGDIREAVKAHPDPSAGKQMIGYLLTALAAAGYVGLLFFLSADGLRRGYGFWRLFGRYMLFLYGYKLFDILVQDQYIVITRKYFVKFYPETKNCRSWDDRSFNTKNQLIRLIAFPFVCTLMAWITLLIGR